MSTIRLVVVETSAAKCNKIAHMGKNLKLEPDSSNSAYSFKESTHRPRLRKRRTLDSERESLIAMLSRVPFLYSQAAFNKTITHGLPGV